VENRRVLLIIDEAQNLPRKTLEEIRMLSNLESEKHHLLQIILVGQPELKSRLQEKGLQQFVQRISVHCHLNALSKDEIREYIGHRLDVAGGSKQELFTEGALESITLYSHGIPRLINILCDTALVYGFADGIEIIERKTIEQVLKSREAGGVFSESAHGREEYTRIGPEEGEISQNGEWRSPALEERIKRLEGTLFTLQQELNSLRKEREIKDTIVLELLKMIKDSMESRRKLIAWTAKVKQKLENNKSKIVREEQNKATSLGIEKTNPKLKEYAGKEIQKEEKKHGFFFRLRDKKNPASER
jgi:general secretion pathway protein A